MNVLATLRLPPEPLTKRQRTTLLVLALVVAVSRLLALSKTMWDWDEALFASALHDYDVVPHHPHPPGFPVFVFAARTLRVFFHSDFRALQCVTLAGALVLFPLLFAFARELRLPFVTAAGAALLYVFLPNVWFYGGTAFSDISASAMLLLALTLLLRGCHDRRAYFLGALALGLAVGFRTQTLIIGCAPSLLASYVRLTDATRPLRARWRDFLLVIVLGAVTAAVPYVIAAYVSSDPPHGYLTSCAALREYVRTIDSFMAPGRAPLPTLLGNFFIRPMWGGHIAWVFTALAALGLIAAVVRRGRRASLAAALLTFVPFIVFAWLMLDPASVERYSTGYVMLHALLAAAGAELVASAAVWIARGAIAAGRRDGAALLLQALLIVVVAAAYVRWTWPALREVKDVSPPIRALDFVRTQWKPSDPLYVSTGMLAPGGHEIGDDHLIRFDTTRLPLMQAPPGAWYCAEDTSISLRSHDFRRPLGRISQLVRDRYFLVTVYPLSDAAQLTDGWFGREWDGTVGWVWSDGPRGRIRLFPLTAPPATVRVAFSAPTHWVGKETIDVRFNGVLLERVLMTTERMDKSYAVNANTNAFNELELTADRTYTPSDFGQEDARPLGVRLDGVTFGAR